MQLRKVMVIRPFGKSNKSLVVKKSAHSHYLIFSPLFSQRLFCSYSTIPILYVIKVPRPRGPEQDRHGVRRDGRAVPPAADRPHQRDTEFQHWGLFFNKTIFSLFFSIHMQKILGAGKAAKLLRRQRNPASAAQRVYCKKCGWIGNKEK
jgi:hypothetical protein